MGKRTPGLMPSGTTAKPKGLDLGVKDLAAADGANYSSAFGKSMVSFDDEALDDLRAYSVGRLLGPTATEDLANAILGAGIVKFSDLSSKAMRETFVSILAAHKSGNAVLRTLSDLGVVSRA